MDIFRQVVEPGKFIKILQHYHSYESKHSGRFVQSVLILLQKIVRYLVDIMRQVVGVWEEDHNLYLSERCWKASGSTQ